MHGTNPNLEWFRLAYEAYASPTRESFMREYNRTAEQWEEAQVFLRVMIHLDNTAPELFEELFDRAFPNAP